VKKNRPHRRGELGRDSTRKSPESQRRGERKNKKREGGEKKENRSMMEVVFNNNLGISEGNEVTHGLN